VSKVIEGYKSGRETPEQRYAKIVRKVTVKYGSRPAAKAAPVRGSTTRVKAAANRPARPTR
jgi:hypothetical protein